MPPVSVRSEFLEPRRLLAAQLVADVNPVSPGTQAADATVLNDTLFFGWGNGLWKTDGTEGGTSRVATVGANLDTWYSDLAPLPRAGVFLFRGRSAPDTPAVFRSDGTPEGTV